MARQALIDTFTTNDEINYWVIGDDTIELCGYIDQIEGMKKVSGGKSQGQGMSSLFKIIINNGSGSRVRVLFWGQKAIEFSGTLRNGNIVTINRSRASEVNRRFSNPADGVGPVELSITNASAIEIANNLFDSDDDDSQPKIVKLEDAPDSSGRLSISGWLKLPFASVVSYGSTIGSGVIIDGMYKLRVSISDYRTPVTILKGAYVTIIGETTLDSSQRSSILMVRSSADIRLDTDKPPLEVVQMRSFGLITASKRKTTEESEVAYKRPLIA
ncbi:uncharacterized protein LOC141535164 [Cotesia typhae]|uniref:uncharacterized protein LOC141535164 n=1 Tax=Cotesia typhae TaxID=2053667 RepID=UPI003D68BC6F